MGPPTFAEWNEDEVYTKVWGQRRILEESLYRFVRFNWDVVVNLAARQP